VKGRRAAFSPVSFPGRARSEVDRVAPNADHLVSVLRGLVDLGERVARLERTDRESELEELRERVAFR